MNCKAALLLASVLLGCGGPSGTSSTSDTTAANDQLIVPGTRVGQWVIGHGSLASILGSDTPEARKQFANRGLEFQFERGKALAGITVWSAEYATREGFRVGSLAADIEAVLGEPLRRTAREVHGKFELPILAYDGIGFCLEGDAVRAVWVGKS